MAFLQTDLPNAIWRNKGYQAKPYGIRSVLSVAAKYVLCKEYAA